MNGKLFFEDGTIFSGQSFGAQSNSAGELVFSTGMVGYPESFTDPSFKGQILILTYPIIGNYGVPNKEFFESDSIQISGLIVSNYINTPSHFQSEQTLSNWLTSSNIPALEIPDTRILAQKLRDKGSVLGKIEITGKTKWYNPNTENLVAQVSTKEIQRFKKGGTHIILIDCGAKKNITNCLLKRGVSVSIVPWDYDPFEHNEKYDALLISNGPGDPKMAQKTIKTIQKAMDAKIPTLGICLGNQLLALAGGGDTKKLKFGHRSQNQPCIMEGSKRCFITTQNHGFEVYKIPDGFKSWFTNANDNSNEGIIHKKLPFMSVQFHPEAKPGPEDTEWIFDTFLQKI